MHDDTVCWLGAVELGRRIAGGELTSLAATEALLARIERLNPSLEAYVTVTAELARAEAARADAELAAGRRRGPLHGVPYCLKDIVETAGIRTTVGSYILADWIPERDATIVHRLRAAGTVLLGKVNTHEFAFGATTQNIHGRTRNPWDLERIPGGSSGGSGAAVAAGLAFFAIGSDTAGSIRLPAAFCGIAGLKPTYGLVSATGVVPQSYTADHVGPMARRVEDLAAIMAAMAGPDPEDPTCLVDAPPSFDLQPPTSLTGIRIGIPRELMTMPLAPAVADGFAAARAALRQLGAEVSEISVPLLAEASRINNAIVPPETAAQHEYWAETWFRGRNIRYHQDVAALLAGGQTVPATAHIRACRDRISLRRELDAALDGQVELLLTPCQAITASRPSETVVDLGGKPRDALPLMIHFLCGFSLSGHPTLALPAGLSPEGLPVGIQLIGRRGGDPRLMAIGATLESALNLNEHPPLFA